MHDHICKIVSPGTLLHCQSQIANLAYASKQYKRDSYTAVNVAIDLHCGQDHVLQDVNQQPHTLCCMFERSACVARFQQITVHHVDNISANIKLNQNEYKV